jgi:arsenite-transporting ATPase
VINQSLANSGTHDPLLHQRELTEHRYIDEVVNAHAKRSTLLHWQIEEPVGVTALAQLSEQ